MESNNWTPGLYKNVILSMLEDSMGSGSLTAKGLAASNFCKESIIEAELNYLVDKKLVKKYDDGTYRRDWSNLIEACRNNNQTVSSKSR